MVFFPDPKGGGHVILSTSNLKRSLGVKMESSLLLWPLQNIEQGDKTLDMTQKHRQLRDAGMHFLNDPSSVQGASAF